MFTMLSSSQSATGLLLLLRRAAAEHEQPCLREMLQFVSVGMIIFEPPAAIATPASFQRADMMRKLEVNGFDYKSRGV